MALFDRSELVLGSLLGNGAFCQVHELKEVHLNTNKVLSKLYINNKLHQADRTREYIRQTCLRQQEQRDQDTLQLDVSSDEDDSATENSQRTPQHDQPRYVVKLLKPNLATQRSYKVFLHAAADLRMEYEILSRLSHPNIVQLKGGAITESHHYHTGPLSNSELATQEYFLLLERLEETLSQRIVCWKNMGGVVIKTKDSKRDRIPRYYLEKLRIARDIASALSYAHQQRYIFRDLKPDNVALTADGTAKLIDFGLCRELPKVKDDSSIRRGKEPLFRMSGVGTRRYMAPEMIMSRGYNQKVDSYSWAMVFFEMLCLEKPYSSYNRETHKILVCENRDRPCPTAEVPHAAHKLLEAAWTQDSGDRLSMVEIHSELEAMMDSAQREALPLHERSLKVVMEMAELLGVEDSFLSGGGLNKREDSLISRKSTAELTVSTATSASSDMSILSSPWR
ncbi:MAG: hypothetical protein SGILL_006733 [Bacillariaceae sp.]